MHRHNSLETYGVKQFSLIWRIWTGKGLGSSNDLRDKFVKNSCLPLNIVMNDVSIEWRLIMEIPCNNSSRAEHPFCLWQTLISIDVTGEPAECSRLHHGLHDPVCRPHDLLLRSLHTLFVSMLPPPGPSISSFAMSRAWAEWGSWWVSA